MRRVSASLAVVMLAASGHPVTTSTLRSWVHRGHITRGPGGYDLHQILTYIEHRETRMATQFWTTRQKLDAVAAHLDRLAKRLRELDDGSQLGDVEVSCDYRYEDIGTLGGTPSGVERLRGETFKLDIEWAKLRDTPVIDPGS